MEKKYRNFPCSVCATTGMRESLLDISDISYGAYRLEICENCAGTGWLYQRED